MGKETTAADVDPWDDDVELEGQDRGDNPEGSAEPEGEEGTQETSDTEKPEGEGEQEPAAEKTDETEQTAAPEEEPDAGEEEEPASNQNYMVPKHRYDSAKERAQRAEQKALELEQQLQQGNRPAQQERDSQTRDEAPDFDSQLSEIDRNHAKALADGDYEQAAQLASRARQVEREMYRSEIEASSRRAMDTARESTKLDQTINEVYEQYPTLDPDSGSFDQEKTDEVLRLQGAFSAAGMAPSAAVQEAVKYAFNIPDTVEMGEKETDKPAAKRTTDVDRNVKTANSQPPDMKSVGSDNGSAGVTEEMPDITKLTDEEFDALPESKLRLLRGDVL